MAEWGDTANPLTTDRLVVRVMRPHDIPTFAAYRNDPDVARHQLWDLPYTDDDAHGDLDDQADRSDVVAGRWTLDDARCRLAPAVIDCARGISNSIRTLE